MRRNRLLGLLLVCGIVIGGAGAAAAQPLAGVACSCPVAGEPNDPGGIVWRGSGTHSNVLDLQPDTVLPLTILVEEGKHASCPDRNADGIFTPGYDVNVRVNDAWGIRDVMGAGAVLGTSFSSSMAKTREAAFRLSPPASEAACAGARGPARLAQSPGLGQYELRPASSVPHCPLVGREAGRLADMMEYHDFGEPPDQHSTEVGLVLTGPESVSRMVTGINARIENSKLGVGITGPGLDLPVFWLVPRLSIVGDSYSAEALITPSASRWAGGTSPAGIPPTRRKACASMALPARSA